jgi:anhydro-N-acetylmuramic acid kinase
MGDWDHSRDQELTLVFNDMTTKRWVVGAMTGTSIDGIDVVLVEIIGSGLDMRVSCACAKSCDMSPDLSKRLRDFADKDNAMTAKELTVLQKDFSQLHIDAIRELLNSAGTNQSSIDLISVHGQTVYHSPPFLSMQLFTPAPLAHEFNTTVVCDLRAADIAAGGEGAPLTPLADYVLFRDHEGKEMRAIVNLGGFCNITILSGDNTDTKTDNNTVDEKCVKGFDVCACSQLLDTIARNRLNCSYDEDGNAALAGVSNESIVNELTNKLREQSLKGRSLGTFDSPAQWISLYDTTSGNDIAASACDAIAIVMKEKLDNLPYESTSTSRVMLAGGGAYNKKLLSSIKKVFGDSIITQCTDEHPFNVGIGYREAIGWAVLGALSQDKVPITLSNITGVNSPPVAGLWAYPPYL